MEFSAERPRARKRCSASRSRMPFFATMPMTMIMPMKEATLNVVRVMRRASKPPNVESSAEARMAVGAGKGRNSKRRTGDSRNNAKTKNIKQAGEEFIWSAEVAAYFTRVE